MATAKGAPQSVEMFVSQIDTERIEFCVLGKTPLIMNRMSQKAMQELLAPKGRKTAAERAQTLKHDPVQEFRDSPYILRGARPTYLGVMSSAFKRAMADAAVDTPGAVRTKIEKLVYVPGMYTEVYGIPKLFMAIVRSSDINKTPDVRTRAILPEWACTVEVEFVRPNLKAQSIANLLVAAGHLCGIGDWRQEKGSGNYGSFTIVNRDNRDWQRIVKTQGRPAQIAALQKAEPFDEESESMLSWFETEVRIKRGAARAAAAAAVEAEVELAVRAKKTPLPSAKTNGASKRRAVA